MSTVPSSDDAWVESFGAHLRAAREAANMSRSKLARMLDMPEQNVKNWETGKALPSLPHFLRIRRVLPGFDEATRVYLHGGNRRPNAVQLPTVAVVTS